MVYKFESHRLGYKSQIKIKQKLGLTPKMKLTGQFIIKRYSSARKFTQVQIKSNKLTQEHFKNPCLLSSQLI